MPTEPLFSLLLGQLKQAVLLPTVTIDAADQPHQSKLELEAREGSPSLPVQ